MDKAGLLETRAVPVSPAVAETYAAARAAYAAGDLGPLQGRLAIGGNEDRIAGFIEGVVEH